MDAADDSQMRKAVTLTVLVISIIGLVVEDTASSVSTTTTARIETLCTYVGMGSLVIHVADENGKPIQNAIVMINGTATCVVDGVTRTGTADRSQLTDSDGNVVFAAYPIKYNVSVTLPSSLEPILVTEITAPVGTYRMTLDIACTRSMCTVKSETQTTSVTAAPIPFLDFPAILFAILLGLFVVGRNRRRGRFR